MDLTSSEKINKIVEYYGITIRDLERKISTSSGQLAKVKDRNSALKDEILDKILTAFPEINAYWLITGRGSMIYSAEKTNNKCTTAQDKEYKTLLSNFLKLSSVQQELAGSLMKFYEENNPQK